LDNLKDGVYNEALSRLTRVWAQEAEELAAYCYAERRKP
jgi:hypothetical protein